MKIAEVLGGLVKAAPTGGKEIVAVIKAAAAVVAAANLLKDQAKPLLSDADVQAMAQGLKAGAGGVAKNAGQAVGGAAEKAGQLFAKVGDAKGELVGALAQAKDRRDLEKAVSEARQSVLENATTAMRVEDLLKAKEKAGDGGIGPLNNLPGCFVIATYRKLDFDKDLTDYVSLYIGRADNVAQSVETAISREGDPDVYADVKYKQNVHVFVFNCPAEELDSLQESLEQTFCDTAGESDASQDA